MQQLLWPKIYSFYSKIIKQDSFYSNSDIIVKCGNFFNKCCKMKFEGVC